MTSDATTSDLLSPQAPSIVRHVHHRGMRAYSWLREHGWEVDMPLRSDALIYADELRTTSVVARRLHASALSLRPASATRTTRTLFLLQAEGSSEIAFHDGTVTTLESLGYLSVPLADVAAVRSHGPVARMEIVADLPLFSVQGAQVVNPSTSRAPHASGEGRSSAAPAAWHVVTSAVNAVLNSALTSESAALPALEASLLHALVALTVESRGAMVPQGQASMLSHAQDALRRNAHRPDFTVAQLAASMNVSTRYLTRLFREAGTSPGRALRAARISRAQLGLRAGGTPVLADVARAAGFSSVRAMKEAFRLSGLPLGA